MPDRVIGLKVTERIGPERVVHAPLRLDNDFVASNQELTVPQSQAVQELSVWYGQLFEQRHPPQLAREELAAIGA